MNAQPTLQTERLVLRPFAPQDAPHVQRLAGVPEVALTTLNIPYPYPDGAAEAWIARHAQEWAKGRVLTWAITGRGGGELTGAVGIDVHPEHARGEIGYWIAHTCWGRGYATEAARAMLAFGFGTRGLNRVQATYMTRNPASGRVMEKLGMRLEGTLRQWIRRGGRFEDVAMRAVLRAEWTAG